MEVYGRPLSERLLADLTHSPGGELWGVLKQPSGHGLEPRRICREPTNTSLGLLDVLPIELVFNVIEFLDFQTLLRLMHVSLQWKLTVEALPAYEALTTHAQGELNKLARVGMIKHHTAYALYNKVLLSQECASCSVFGGFLFLPTCERICYECLMQNPAYWVFSFPMAKKCFTLTEAELSRLPFLLLVPASDLRQRTQSSLIPLVSVKQAKELANKKHGSSSMTAIKYLEGKPAVRVEMYQRLQTNSSLDSLGPEFSRQLKKFPNRDAFGCAAVIRFPFVKAGQVDYGRLCRGCEHISRNRDNWNWLNKKFPRLWSRSEFIEHIKGCDGVKQLLAERES